jgi:hypothetical protein
MPDTKCRKIWMSMERASGHRNNFYYWYQLGDHRYWIISPLPWSSSIYVNIVHTVASAPIRKTEFVKRVANICIR